jgi:hypothetical protein
VRSSVAVFIVTVLLGLASAEVSTDAIAELQRIRPGVKWDEKSAVFADVFCEGKRGMIIFGSEKDVVVIGAVSGTRPFKTQVLSFPIRRDTQNGFCALPKRIEIFPLKCATDEGPLPGCKPARGCKEFSVMDEECDSFNFYWESSRKSLAWWRH